MYRSLIGALVRRRVLAVLACGVLCGLVAGVGLWGLAAARRTASAYERYLDAAEASDLSVNVNAAERALTLDEVVGFVDEADRLPGVVDSATYVGLESMLLAQDLERPDAPLAEIVGSLDGRFLDQDRIAVVDGRLPRADRSHEVLLNDVAADLRGLTVGDRTEILVASIEDLEAGNFDESGLLPIQGRFDAEVVGIGTFPDDALDDEYDRLSRVLLTPAATAEWIDVAGSYVWHGLRLEHPGDVDRVAGEYRRIAGEGTFLNTLVTSDQAADVQHALRPLVAALAAFGFAALVAALAVGAVAATRLTRLGPDAAVLRAVGVRPRQLGLVTAAPAALAAVLAALVATGTAVALSPLAPVGAIRAVEPHRGVDADALVLAAGAALVAFVLVGTAAIASARGLRPAPAALPTRASWVGRASSGLPVSAALGIRRGMGSAGASGTPARSTVVGITLAALAVAASLTFGASLSELADEPARYGWATDLALPAGSGYDTIDVHEAGELADADARIEGLTVVGFTDVELGDELVPAMAYAALRGDPAISVVSGRLPEGDGEVALGGRTARRHDVGRGDTVPGASGPLRVVGLVTFPAIGSATSAHPAMGEGVLLPLEVLGDEGAQPSIAFLDLAEGVDPDEVGAELAATFAEATDGGFMEPFTDLQPAELDGAEDADRTVRAIALVVGAAALVGLATVVMASVRARQRELAVLRTLGLTAADLRRSVRWQATSLVVVALALGLPLGVAGGRVLWRIFADALGVDPAPTVPVLALAAVALAAAVLALLAAVPAALRAGRLPLAPALRPE